MVILLGGWSYQSFFRYRGCIDELLEDIPNDEKDLPPKIAAIFIRSKIVEKTSDSYEAIFFQCRNQNGLKHTEFQVQKLVWMALIPLYLSYQDRLSLSVHLMSFRDGRGLSYGAKHYFSKNINNLTEQETIKLILIAQSPTFYSHGNDVDRLNQGVAEFKRRLENDQ